MNFRVRSTFETGYNSFLIYLHILLWEHVLQTIYNTRTCRCDECNRIVFQSVFVNLHGLQTGVPVIYFLRKKV